ncbi:hypothetical protein B0H14DRAFT_2659136 [Mycena olivaceomarginata]|nr:hypothetical protein B0H14DRAFT_2659136 [Mycena olivaceomarginata]
MTGKREGQPLLWATFKQHREEGGAGGSSCCRLHSGVGGVGGIRLGRYTGVHLMEMELQEGGRRSGEPPVAATLVSEVLKARTAKQYRKAGGAGDTHVEGHI